MDRGRHARRRAGGGERVQALRPHRPLSFAAALALFAAVLAYPVAGSAGLREPFAAFGALALVGLAVGVIGRWGVVLQAAFSVAVGQYAGYLLERGEVDALVPVYAALLFAAAELAYDSIEPRGARESRAGFVMLLAAAAGVVALLVLGVAGFSVGGLLIEVVGVIAAAATLALLARLAWANR